MTSELKKIKDIQYRNIEITVYQSTEDNSFHADSICGKALLGYRSNLDNYTLGFPTEEEAIEAAKKKIDRLYKTVPKSYKELAEEVENYIIANEYGECVIQPKVLEILIKNFIEVC
jgi:hypothetical protein